MRQDCPIIKNKEINDQETDNNRGNYQNNYRGNNSRGRGGYQKTPQQQ
jgi:hypothetical protein